MDAIVSENGQTKIKTRRVGKFKHWDLLLNATLILAVVFTVLAYRLPVFSNVLYVHSRTHDFGRVAAGIEVRHTFTIRNLHPWPVTVTALIGTCGCTRSIPDRDLPFRLGPLQSVTVNAAEDNLWPAGASDSSHSRHYQRQQTRYYPGNARHCSLGEN